MKTLAIGVIVTGLLAAACGGGAASGTGGTGTVTATLTDNTVKLDQTSVASGTVTFKVVNSGTVVHSLILLKTDIAHDKLPADPKDAAKVEPTGLLKETGQIAVGKAKEFSAKLEAGKYVLVCNEPAHYAIGMHVGFTVK